jgi:hypothetical protein
MAATICCGTALLFIIMWLMIRCGTLLRMGFGAVDAVIAQAAA